MDNPTNTAVMTEDQFFAELAALPRDNFPFEITPTGGMRSSANGRWVSPIELVCFRRFGYFANSWPHAAEDLSLAAETALRLVKATNQEPGHDPTLRERFIIALDLNEEQRSI